MRIRRATVLSFVLSLSLLASAPAPLSAARPRTIQSEQTAKFSVASSGNSTAAASAAIQARVERTLDGLPLYFVENRGQADEQVAYYVPGKDNSIYFTPQGVTFALSAPLTPTTTTEAGSQMSAAGLPGRAARNPVPPSAQRWAVKLDFVGANPDVQPLGENKAQATFSYFKGRPDQWQAGLSTFTQIRYPDLWPGIDLVYSGQANQLKYEFVVQPGADPARIQLAYRGASDVRLTAEGQLEVTTPLGGFRDAAPVAYQVKDGRRVPVAMSYALSQPAAAGETVRYGYSFHLGRYDPSLPLVLDPAALVYAGYIGGSSGDLGYSIAMDGTGNAYITGRTYSDANSFPVTVGPDLNCNCGDAAFVAKVAVATILNVDAYVTAPAWVGAPPAGVAAIPVQFSNNGATIAMSATLTAMLGSGLTYLGDTSGFTPTVAGNTITWALPNLSFMYPGQFVIAVAVPSAPFGTRYPVTLTLTSAGPEANPADNLVNLQVMIARQNFLPLIHIGYANGR